MIMFELTLKRKCVKRSKQFKC